MLFFNFRSSAQHGAPVERASTNGGNAGFSSGNNGHSGNSGNSGNNANSVLDQFFQPAPVVQQPAGPPAKSTNEIMALFRQPSVVRVGGVNWSLPQVLFDRASIR